MARAPRLTLITRAECGLCEEMHANCKRTGARASAAALELVDVDADPLLQRRYGLKVPVLLLDGAVVCQQRLDRGELLRLLRL